MYRIIHKDQPKEAVFRSLVNDFFKDNPDVGAATISISKDKPKRSDAQNRLYFSWVDIIGKELGYSKSETHLLLADKFLGKIEFTTKKGKEISQIKSTRELKVLEFTDYLMDIDIFVSEYGITLPHGDDYNLAIGSSNGRQAPQS
jgi:hypothetical protein